MKDRPAITVILLGGGLLLCSIAALIGVVCLIFGIDVLAGSLGGFIDSYVWGMIFWAFVFGLGILIPGIVGIVLCVRRLKVMLGRRPGRGPAYLFLGPAALCVLVGVALMMKPISGGHLQLQLLAGRRSFADIKLEGAKLKGVNLGRANLRGADLRNATLFHADLSDADLIGVNLSDADLRDANLSGANLQGADLARASLWGADLRGANLSGARLDWADLEGTLLDDRTQIDAKWKLVWELVTIGGAGRDLRQADLSNAMLSQADLRAADLSQANLTNARLVHADLDGASLKEADLTGTILQYANLSNVNLSGAIVSTEQLAGARSLEGATMSDGTKR